MYPRSNQSSSNSYKKLREVHSNQLGTARKGISSLQEEEEILEVYKRENQQLKVRCAKIDEIEKYVHILVNQDEHLKRTNKDLEITNSEFKRLINDLRHSADLKKNRDQQQTQVKQQQINLMRHKKDPEEIDRERCSLKVALQSALEQKTLLEHLNNQLKSQESLLLSEGEQLKETILELEEVKYSQMRQIQKLANQLNLVAAKKEVREGEMRESEQKHKQLIAALERDNMQIREQNQRCQQDNITKQNEIHDLINIVSTLEGNIKEAEESIVHLQEINSRLETRYKEVQIRLEAQAMQLETLSVLSQKNEKYAKETQKNYVDLKTNFLQMQLKNGQESHQLQQLSDLLQKEKKKSIYLEDQVKVMTSKSSQREELLSHSQQVIDQCEKLYAIEKDNHNICKERVVQLEDNVDFLKRSIASQQKAAEKEINSLRQTFISERSEFMKNGLESLEKLLSGKFQEVLRQKSEHFKTKIKYLESEISLLSREEQFNKFD